MNGIKILMTLMAMEIGGAETHVLELCKTLKDKGLDVYVVSNGGVYVQELEGHGIKHYKVPLHNKQMLNVFSSYRAIRRIILENNIKLVHSHARIPAFLCGILQKRLPFRFVTTAHLDFSLKFPFNKLTNWGEKTLAVSDDIKQYLLTNYKIKEKNIFVTVNGIDTGKFSPEIPHGDIRAEFDLRPDTVKIVCVSRMDPDRSRAALTLIKIAEEIASEYFVEIILVGGGEDWEKIKSQAARVNHVIGRRVLVLTGQRTDINKFMALADIFVNVSRSAMEALAAEKPLILAGNQGYIGIFGPENLSVAIDTNFCCRGCPELTAGRLLADLKTLLAQTPDQRQALGRYGRGIIHAHYSLDRMADDAIAVYTQVLAAPRGGRARPEAVISGYYGYNNSGDDILLQSIIENLRVFRRDLSVTVLSMKPGETRAQYGVNAIHRFNFPAVYRKLRRSDLLITGGGSLIQDETSTQSLIYYLWVINTARRLGVRNMLYANGIGPVLRPGNYPRVRKSLNRVDLITLRESASLQVLREIGVTLPETYVTADAVFALPPADPESARQYLRALGVTGPFFCVAIRSWKHNPPGLEAEIARFADAAAERYGYRALFIPMRPVEDAEISRRVMALMKNENAGILADLTRPDDIRGVLGLSVFVLGMRLHALIFAVENTVPIIGLVYGPKIQGLMESMGQPFYMPVEQTDASVLLEYAETIHTQRAAVTERIREAGRMEREKAARNAEYCAELMHWV